jgi:hypothetical protein
MSRTSASRSHSGHLHLAENSPEAEVAVPVQRPGVVVHGSREDEAEPVVDDAVRLPVSVDHPFQPLEEAWQETVVVADQDEVLPRLSRSALFQLSVTGSGRSTLT